MVFAPPRYHKIKYPAWNSTQLVTKPQYTLMDYWLAGANKTNPDGDWDPYYNLVSDLLYEIVELRKRNNQK